MPREIWCIAFHNCGALKRDDLGVAKIREGAFSETPLSPDRRDEPREPEEMFEIGRRLLLGVGVPPNEERVFGIFNGLVHKNTSRCREL